MEIDFKDFHILECLCKVCKSCLIKKIKLTTEDLVLYNTYEQSNYCFTLEFIKLKTIACFCYNEFNYFGAVNTFTEDEMNDYIKASNERLSQQVQGFCMECESTVSKDDQTSKNKVKNFTVKILETNNRTNSDHVLCSTCFEKYKSISEDKYKSLSTTIHCNLCEIIHNIDPKLWENKLYKNKKCCDCIIF